MRKNIYKLPMQLNKLSLYLSLLFVLILSTAAIAQDRTWTPYSPDSKAWSIVAPGKLMPDGEALKPSSDKGSYTYNDYNGFFAVIYRDSPTRFVPWKPNYKSYYKKVRDEAVEAANGEMISDEEFTNGTVKGREVYVKLASGKVMGRESQVKTIYRMERFRMFFKGKRFYILLVVLPEDQINTPAINSYLNSFVAW